MCVSWSTVQGLTIPYIFVNLKQFDNNNNQYPYNIGSKNNIMYKNIAKIGMASTQSYQMPNDALEPGHNKHANWFVTLGRVRSLKNIWVNAPSMSKQSKEDYTNAQLVLNNYMRCVFQPALDFEAKFKEKSLLLQQIFRASLAAEKEGIDNLADPPLYEIKAVHPIVLMDHKHEEELQAQFLIRNQTENNIKEKNIDQEMIKLENIVKCLYNPSFFSDLASHIHLMAFTNGHATLQKINNLISNIPYNNYVIDINSKLEPLKQRFLSASNNTDDHVYKMINLNLQSFLHAEVSPHVALEASGGQS